MKMNPCSSANPPLIELPAASWRRSRARMPHRLLEVRPWPSARPKPRQQPQHDAVGETALAIAATKSSLPTVQLFFLAVLCNVLVCLAVWMSFGARSVTEKAVVIVPTISAFVAAGFEHSIANLYLLPYALAVKASRRLPGRAGSTTMALRRWNICMTVTLRALPSSIPICKAPYR